MDLVRIGENLYYIPAPTNIGVIVFGEGAFVVDSGLDDEAGRRILRALEKNGLRLMGIVNTHSHADHCGGNSYLKKRTGARIYAPRGEVCFIENTMLEPLFLFSGASPPEEMRNRFLMAKPSEVDGRAEDLAYARVISLRGHSIDQVGVIFDDVLFCADSVFSKRVIEKHGIPYHSDVDEERRTLNALRESRYRLYVPSHAEPTQDIRNLVEENLEAIRVVEDNLIEVLKENKGTDEIVSGVLRRMKIEVKDLGQYMLLRSALMAYLSSLRNRGIVRPELRDGVLMWLLEA
ncbi:MAG: MBL fold metallo-hydrolase [Candidatus Methanodesulfokora sp.]|jgi:glyoxylase-like metal-dependent hydrolase (beta-lactamase superfamily II)